MNIENKNDFILSVVLSSIWLIAGIALLFTNFWIIGIVFASCGVYSAISPVKYYISLRKAIPSEEIETIEVND